MRAQATRVPGHVQHQEENAFLPQAPLEAAIRVITLVISCLERP